MQIISFCLFALLCSYSLVIAAPIKPVVPATQDAKHQKAHEIANRLLKELAGGHVESETPAQSSNTKEEEEHKEASLPAVNRPVTEKVETHVEKPDVDDSYDEDNQDLELTPTLDDLYEIYNNNYLQLYNDDESSEVIDEDENEDDDDEDYLLPVSRQDLFKYLDSQEESEHLTTGPHVDIMDDTVMTAEDHQRRRRSIN
ncbi:unnamed protein product [Adineta ricciae]|uniref:Uncharacterized protein n=1 Tax=Adineta ricciae TaxID=249248 RepID=A0A813RDY2_ADIRI|nr:unnamed protein product [Adineta ricciae]